jgi:hypothetical protein
LFRQQVHLAAAAPAGSTANVEVAALESIAR